MSSLLQNPNQDAIETQVDPLSQESDRDLLQGAYVALQARIAEANRDAPVATGIDTLTAAKIIFGALPGIMKYRSQAARLDGFDIRTFDALEQAVHAALFTQYEYQSLSRPPEPVHDLVEKARTMLDRLLFAARALAHSGVISAGFDGQLNGGLGYAQLAADVSVMARVFQREWAVIQGKTAITEAEWSEAKRLGDKLLRVVAEREQQHTAREEMAELRQKAKVFLIETYDEARRAIAYLRWKEGDATQIVPSLFAGRTVRKPKEEEPIDDMQPVEPVPPVVPVTPVSPVTPITPAKGAVAPTDDAPFTT